MDLLFRALQKISELLQFYVTAVLYGFNNVSVTGLAILVSGEVLGYWLVHSPFAELLNGIQKR